MSWQLLNASSLECVNFLIALFTEVSIISFEHFTLYESVKTLLNRFLILNRDAEGKEIFLSLVFMRAALADHLTCKLSSKMLLDCMLLRRSFDSSFNSIHEHVEEFLNVHLFKDVSSISLPVLESVAETFRTHVLLL